MTTTMLDAQWSADPTQPGRIAAGDAITIDVRVASWRVPGGDSEAMRLVKEAEALVVAAPAMAKALRAFLPENGHTFECGNGDAALQVKGACSEECAAARAALALACVPLP